MELSTPERATFTSGLDAFGFFVPGGGGVNSQFMADDLQYSTGSSFHEGVPRQEVSDLKAVLTPVSGILAAGRITGIDLQNNLLEIRLRESGETVKTEIGKMVLTGA